SEGFGMVIMEALSQRLPVVCSATAGAAALLHQGREALLTPPRDPEALAAALARLWRSPGLRQALAEAGHQCTQALTWQQVGRQTIDVYQDAWQEAWQDAWRHHHPAATPHSRAGAAC
ncbi:MAG TPA: glycosyltransferase, partial [Terriglobales bacterium]|nr:glycosyltransferase [Terriglobales bacterium]